MTDTQPNSPSVAVVHRCIPGPRSADPRNRQIFRRLLDLRALGFEVTLVPMERVPEGGAPVLLARHGVRIEDGPRESASSRLERVSRSSTMVMLTGLDLPANILDAASQFAGTLVLELDHLPSSARTAARAALRSTEAAGLDTEIENLLGRERPVLQRADLVICNSTATARDAEKLMTSKAGPVVIPPTVPVVGRSGSRLATVVVPGRFSDEFATPDESVVRRLVGDLLLPKVDSGGFDERLLLTPEDTVPRLRYSINGRIDIAELHDVHERTSSALAALDMRTYGLPTTARRAEFMASGIPVVTSPVALGTAPAFAAGNLPTDENGHSEDRQSVFEASVFEASVFEASVFEESVFEESVFGEFAVHLVGEDPDHQRDLLERLCGDDELNAEISAGLRELAVRFDPQRTRELLANAFDAAGIEASIRDESSLSSGLASGVTNGNEDEYLVVRKGGTLADADPRIAQLEREMVPLRLHTRENSINLQSTMDPDQRYRVYSRTHLEAPPASTPPSSGSAERIRFSVLIPTYNTDPGLLAECLDSVASQIHSNWEMCIVDDGSTQRDHIDLLEQRAATDQRIKIQLNPYNQGIALASNDALAMATGDWVVLLDHDDVLKPDALAWVATYIDRCPDYDLWYSDEDKIDLERRLSLPFFKPDWSPDLLMGVNYVCHLLSVRRELIEGVGGFRGGFDGAQDYDLVLRMVDRARRVGHIAKPLYSWRMIPGSTALDTGAKPKAHFAGHQALRDSIDRRFDPGTVEDGQFDTTHVVRYAVDTEQLLTIMIPIRDRVELLRACVERIRQTSGGIRYELLIVDNQSTCTDTLEYLEDLVAAGHRVVRYPHDFSFARQINLGALHARGDLLLILNNDALARTEDWLVRMMEHAQRPEVGLVGARLMFPEGQRGGRPQHEGIVMGMAGLAYNIDLGGYMGMDQFVRDCSTVTAACVMLRPSVFFAVGGMDERLRVAYNDVDFGLRISELGYRVVYTPFAELEHPESASRKDLHPIEDEDWLVERWGPKNSVREPFISPHFEWLMPVFYRL